MNPDLNHNDEFLKPDGSWEKNKSVWKKQEEKTKHARLYDQWLNSWSLYKN